MKSRYKLSIVVVLVIIVLILTVLFIGQKQTKNLGGSLSEIKGSSLLISGQYINPDSNAPYVNELTDMEIVVDKNTKITRVALHLPTAAELQKTKGYFKVDDLKKDESAADLATMKKDSQTSAVSVMVTGTNIFFNSKKIKASAITYRTTIH